MDAASLQEILGRLLVPDNSVIQQATKDLQSVFKSKGIISPLCQVLVGSQNPQVRQYAAVLLRKKVIQVWSQLPQDQHLMIKSTLLQTLSQETIRLVLHSIAHLIAVIVKRSFIAKVEWPELNSFILEHWNSPEPAHKQLSQLLLSKLMDTAAYYYHQEGNFPNLLFLFSAALEVHTDQTILYYALRSLTSMVAYVGSDEMMVFRELIPKIMTAINTLIAQDEDRACEGMEVFDELIDSDVAIVVPHLKDLITFCLQLSANTTLGNNIRVKALSFVSWLSSLKKKALLNHGLLPTIVETMLSVMATDDDDDEEESSESQSPNTLAAQVLDVLSNHLPPEKLFDPLMVMLTPWVSSTDHTQRGAAIIAIAVVSEGCSDHIRNNHLKALLEVVYKAVQDESQTVRNAALFAIGQFAEFLQPEISEYSGDLMPVLFQFLDMAISSEQAEKKKSSSITKIFYALESFIEQLGSYSMEPYLPTLMDKLFLALSVSKSIHVHELVISAFGAVANACEEKLQPYFDRVVQVLKDTISLPHTTDNLLIQAQAIDTLGTLARTIGGVVFYPLAQDCITLGMNLLQSGDPDMRRSVYGLFASLSGVLPAELTPHLKPIVGRMLQSLISNEGLKVHYTANDLSFFDFEEGAEEDITDSGDEDDNIEGYSVENSYLDEKEDTCNSLGEIAENMKAEFLPYMDDCYREVTVLTEHSVEGIRKAAVWALGRLCKAWYQCMVSLNLEGREDLESMVNASLLSFAATVRTDCDRQVVIATLEMLEDFFKGLKGFCPFPMAEKALDSLLVSVQDVFGNKAQCQEEYDDPIGEEQLSEYDSVLVECAGSVLGPLAGAVGGQVFIPRLKQLLPKLVEKLNGSDGDQSFAIGTLAEIVDGLGSHACHVTSLYETFVNYSSSSRSDEVCSNSIYGLGVLAANGGQEIIRNYPTILQHLFGVVASRKAAKSGRLLDNICGAVARMILTSQDAVPLEQVVPVLIDSLPLKEDMEEVSTVYSCLQQLLLSQHPTVLSQLVPILRAFSHDLSPLSQLSKDTRTDLRELVKAVNSQFPAEVQAASTQLTQEQIQLLTEAINS